MNSIRVRAEEAVMAIYFKFRRIRRAIERRLRPRHTPLMRTA